MDSSFGPGSGFNSNAKLIYYHVQKSATPFQISYNLGLSFDL